MQTPQSKTLSSGIWPHVTKQQPCGICGKGDWCQIGDHGWRCYRVESAKPFKNGGWFHAFSGSGTGTCPPKPKPVPLPPPIDCETILSEWGSQTEPKHIEQFALELGLSIDSISALRPVRCFWRSGLWGLDNFPSTGWAFPMLNGEGKTIGIRLRSNDGRKRAVRGSKNGLFIPSVDPQLTVYLCEGPTSTAAALSMGLYAIGRPACHLGGNEIKVALRRLGVRQAVIVADNDEKPNGLTPGKTGALCLAKEIGVRCVVWTPPTKDIRDFLVSGGTREMIESDLKNFVWKKHS